MKSRRQFLQATAAVAAGVPPFLERTKARQNSSPAPVSAVQVPKVAFGKAEISRLVVGCNQFYGYAHFNAILSAVMKEWYTQDRVCDVLHQCNRFGINAFNYLHAGRAPADLERFRAEGGQMHLIVQGTVDPEIIVPAVKPLAIYRHGGLTDTAYQNGSFSRVREYCKRVRQLGVLVGVGTHKPEVIETVEEQGWDVDFYAGSIYNRTRTPDEFRKVLGGQMPLGAADVYLEGDPARMYRVMRQTKKPCFAFKILAAGRIETQDALDRAFRMTFESIKVTDSIFVGMFPRFKDEVRENVERVSRILSQLGEGALHQGVTQG